MIFVAPICFVLIRPAAETVATFVLLDDQVTSVVVAFEGLTVALRSLVVPFASLRLDALSLMPVTGTYTVTLHVAS